MHPEIDHFVIKVKEKFPEMFNSTRVLEVGSQDINGSVRKHFTYCDYTGIDLGEAPGVDLVRDIVDYIHPNVFDVVISSEMLEHCKEWEQAIKQMYENTRSGGLFILTCAGPKRQEHGTKNHTPQDSKFTLEHYRNISPTDFESVLPGDLFVQYELRLHRGDTDLYFWGIKK